MQRGHRWKDYNLHNKNTKKRKLLQCIIICGRKSAFIQCMHTNVKIQGVKCTRHQRISHAHSWSGN